MNITSPLTGAAQTGLTSPTYTLAEDMAPAPNGKQWYVSALGGTQTGVVANSISRPFTISVYKQAVIKTLTTILGAAVGLVSNIPRNKIAVITRKAAAFNTLGGYGMIEVKTEISVPAGVPENDLVSLKAAMSAHIGTLTQDGNQWWQAAESGGL